MTHLRALAALACLASLASCGDAEDTTGSHDGSTSSSSTSSSVSGSGTGASGGGASTGGTGGTGGATGGSGGTPGVCDGEALVSGDGCGDQGKCSLQFSAQGQVVVGCCPAGQVTEGGACNPVSNPSQDHPDFVCDDCAVGLVCVDFTCRWYCDASRLVCPDDKTCMPTAGIPDAPDYGHCE